MLGYVVRLRHRSADWSAAWQLATGSISALELARFNIFPIESCRSRELRSVRSLIDSTSSSAKRFVRLARRQVPQHCGT